MPMYGGMMYDFSHINEYLKKYPTGMRSGVSYLDYLKQPQQPTTPITQPQIVQQPTIQKPTVPFQSGHIVNPEWFNLMKQTQKQQAQQPQPVQTSTQPTNWKQLYFGNLMGLLRNPSFLSQGQQTTQNDYSGMGLLENRGLYPSSMYNQPQYSNLLSPRYNFWNRR